MTDWRALQQGLNRPVCRSCGSGNLGSIERSISWRPVNFEYAQAAPARAVPAYPAIPAGWYRGDDWGDDTGDVDAESIGVVCLDCQSQSTGDDAEREIITTASAYARTHRVKAWHVVVERLVAAGAGAREQRTVIVQARDAREAREAASESGMVRGRYPWIARTLHYPAGSDAGYFAWPVGTKRPAHPYPAQLERDRQRAAAVPA